MNSARMHCSQKGQKLRLLFMYRTWTVTACGEKTREKKKKKRGNAETKRRRKSKHYLYIAQKMTTPSFRARLVDMFKNWKLLFENIYENTCW